MKARRSLATAGLALEANDVDSAVSRGYYAVFHASVGVHVAFGQPAAATWKSHQQVLHACAHADRCYSWFRELRLVGRSQSLFQAFRVMHSAREQADYQVEMITRPMAQEVLRFASDFVAHVEAVIHEHVRRTQSSGPEGGA